VDGTAVGAWIDPRLDGWGGKVKQHIPQIYDACVRIPTWRPGRSIPRPRSKTTRTDKINPVPDPPPGFDEPGDPDELQRSFFIETLGRCGARFWVPA
jgi:hypothetical protein